jgi:hypothetical protein
VLAEIHFTELLPDYPIQSERPIGESTDWWRVELTSNGRLHRVAVSYSSFETRADGSPRYSHVEAVKAFMQLITELLRIIPSPVPDQLCSVEQLQKR